MRLGTVRLPIGTAVALVSEAGAMPVQNAAVRFGERVSRRTDVLSMLRDWDSVEPQLRRLHEQFVQSIDGDDTELQPLASLGPPIARPGKVIGVGRNYADHARELGNEVPAEPVIFAKYPTSVIGPFDRITRPRFVEDLDYEAELAVVIGRGGRDIAEADALEHVFGYCCANDVSARTAQTATGQFVRGKSFDSFCPLGPAIVSRDEIDDVQDLRVTCRVDGEVRQDSNTEAMIFSVAELVAHCSAATTLEPGDVILTGTPAGVAMGRTPPPWLQPGQVCEVAIDGVGRIANPITAG